MGIITRDLSDKLTLMKSTCFDYCIDSLVSPSLTPFLLSFLPSFRPSLTAYLGLGLLTHLHSDSSVPSRLVSPDRLREMLQYDAIPRSDIVFSEGKEFSVLSASPHIRIRSQQNATKNIILTKTQVKRSDNANL
jgi:hypothetical protein